MGEEVSPRQAAPFVKSCILLMPWNASIPAFRKMIKKGAFPNENPLIK
ncbi:hypothetical protein J22TS1_23750 [Siminovitchia terrae]|nr:hypothetical protein J22TS1_23750 [Siminovitchia terrae]